MCTIAFIFLAFSLMHSSIAQGEPLGPAGEKGEEVTVDVHCVWGKGTSDKQALRDRNGKVVKVTGNKLSFTCKDGATIEALGIADEKHDDLSVACHKQYSQPLKTAQAQPALNEDGSPFLSKSRLWNRVAKGCEARIRVESASCKSIKEKPDLPWKQRSPRPLLSDYWTSTGPIWESFPEEC